MSLNGSSDKHARTRREYVEYRAMQTASRTGLCLSLSFGALAFAGVVVVGQQPPASNGGPATTGVGLIRNDPEAFQGYTLLSPLQSKSTFLIDMNGRVIT